MNKPHLPRTILNASVTNLLAGCCAAGLLSFLGATTAHGQTGATNFTWDGAGVDNLLGNANNWNVMQTPGANAVLHFAGTVNLAPNNNLTLTGTSAVSAIFFDANAGAFTVSGNGLALRNGITNNSGYVQTMSLPVQLAGSQTWTAAANGLVVNSSVDLNGDTLTLAGSHAITFNNPITDSIGSSSPGSLVMNSTGATFLNAANTYTGNTTINSGALIVNGSIASSHVIVNPGGALLGNGTTGAVTNNGIVGPGHIPSVSDLAIVNTFASNAASVSFPNFSASQDKLTLTVHGNYSQNANGTLVIAFAGSKPTDHTALNVQGQANLGGTLRLVQINGGRLKVGDVVPIVTATGGVVGKFDTVANAALINAKVVYEPSAVDLELAQRSVHDALKTVHRIPRNLLEAGAAIDRAANDPRAAKLFAQLNNDNLPQLTKDIQHLNPDTMTSSTSVGASVSNMHMQNLQMHLEAVQSGVTGFSALGFHTADNSVGSDNSLLYAGPPDRRARAGRKSRRPRPPTTAGERSSPAPGSSTTSGIRRRREATIWIPGA